MRHGEVHRVRLALLLAAVMVSAQVPDPSLGSSNERSSIERTYELTKYLEHQLKEIKATYLTYLGPPFSDPDFSPPRPNTTALSLPSAATRLDLWRGLENRARLAQNHRAYSVLLGAVQELARATLCPYLQSSLLHFSAGLDGLLGSISGLMTTLGYALPPQYYGRSLGGGARAEIGGRAWGAGGARGETGGGVWTVGGVKGETGGGGIWSEGGARSDVVGGAGTGGGAWVGGTRRDREGQRSREDRERDPHRDLARGGSPALNPGLSPEGKGEEREREREERGRGERGKGERGRRGQRWEAVNPAEAGNRESEEGEEGEVEGGWGRRRRLLSLQEEEGELEGTAQSRRSSADFSNGYMAVPIHLADSARRTQTQVRTATATTLGADPGGLEPIKVNLTEQLMDEILQSFYGNNEHNNDGNEAHRSHGYAQEVQPHTEQEVHTQSGLEPITKGRDEVRERGSEGGRGRDEGYPSFTSSPSFHPRRSRSLASSSVYTSTLHPPLSPLSLFYQFGAREGHTLLSDLGPEGALSLRGGPQLALGAPQPSSPLLAALSSAPLLHAPSLNDFSRKVESFWVLRELQSWLWRSAKDFNRLKKKLRA